MTIRYLYHVVTQTDFAALSDGTHYRPSSLKTEGFVHCSWPSATVAVAHDYYVDLGPLYLLRINPSKVSAEIKDEAPAPRVSGGRKHLEQAQTFPHIYGPIPLAAIELADVGTSTDFTEIPVLFDAVCP